MLWEPRSKVSGVNAMFTAAPESATTYPPANRWPTSRSDVWPGLHGQGAGLCSEVAVQDDVGAVDLGAGGLAIGKGAVLRPICGLTKGFGASGRCMLIGLTVDDLV